MFKFRLPLATALLLAAACTRPAPMPALPAAEVAAPVAAPAPAPAPLPAAASPAAALPAAVTPTITMRATGEHFAAVWHFTPPKVGELFAADLTVTDAADKPLTAAKITVDATMPAHGHGMMTDPELKQLSPSRWRVEGMKLHMHGSWQFDVRVEAGGVKERLSALYQQAPEAADGI